MPSVTVETDVDAPVEDVFDAARDVDVHLETMAAHEERAVDGVTSGTLDVGDAVTWRARHVGVPLELTAEVTRVERPTYFRDVQVEGPFASFEHDHHFAAIGDARTVMTDEVRFRSPLGPLGAAVDRLVLRRYLRRLLSTRGEGLRAALE